MEQKWNVYFKLDQEYYKQHHYCTKDMIIMAS